MIAVTACACATRGRAGRATIGASTKHHVVAVVPHSPAEAGTPRDVVIALAELVP